MTDLDSVPSGEAGKAAAEKLMAGMEQAVKTDLKSGRNWPSKIAERGASATSGVAPVTRGTVKSLRPATIRPSAFANREAFNWSTTEFQSLKLEIDATGGNTVPILVRPITREAGHEYEIVYGHRRHQACLQLELDVQALVQEMTDAELVLHMAAENRHRKDLSPLELGRQYLRAREMGKFTTIRALATALGMTDHSKVGKYMRLAELPEAIVRAFKSPSDIQVNWAPDLHAAYEMDCMAVLEQADALSTGSQTSDAKFVFERLCGSPRKRAVPAEDRNVVVEHHGHRIATLVMPPPRSRKGITVHLEPGFRNVGQLQAALRACWSEEPSIALDVNSAQEPAASRPRAGSPT